MTDVLGLLAYLVLPLIGLVVWRFDFVREMPICARLGVATAAGALIVAVTMSSMSVIGIEWSRTAIFAVLAIVIAFGVWKQRFRLERGGRVSALQIAIAATWLLTLYGTLTARHSCGDLQFTWGPKAIRWFRAGGLDPQVLHTWPQLTVDYPPLQTLLLALSNTFARQFPWWAAVLASPFFFLALLAVIRG